jgi:hypothetical protein
MKKIIIGGLASISVMIFMVGCGQTVPGISSNTNFNECADINKKLIQVDEYITKVDKMSAFHLEEAALAFQNPKISTSNNKKDILKMQTEKRQVFWQTVKRMAVNRIKNNDHHSDI